MTKEVWFSPQDFETCQMHLLLNKSIDPSIVFAMKWGERLIVSKILSEDFEFTIVCQTQDGDDWYIRPCDIRAYALACRKEDQSRQSPAEASLQSDRSRLH